ncbi:hypothetical protein HELRODRAFT_174471 [Helobdella robusta]|uniref:Fibrinogen C-terminal domain-containing protein n=1 Tax=Helobdella robusta TaxID=6412 RepID=T1F857_HELRO|nr:hypothetical protein HELRODRAFT_174471 [Helobdella robusta]ESO01515.1 hypothetical protein HELRODRAFT_174471 [Helobdella robusta]
MRLVLFVFLIELQASAAGKKYGMIGGPDNPMCFASEPTAVLTNIRSLLECSTKCSHYVSPTDDRITCNAFNYISNNASHPAKYCQLFQSIGDTQCKIDLNRTHCTGYLEVAVKEALSLNYTTTLSKSCNFPFTLNGGLFYSCSNSLPGISNPCALYMCLTGSRQLSICLDPQTYDGVNKTLLLNIPTFANSTPVTSVNGWIVIQQRIDGSENFNQSWTAYKSGFGTYYQNFWLGLEKMHQLATSAHYRLRFEVFLNGSWYSDEYDHFMINSEVEKYSLNVSGYSGDKRDILNCPSVSNLVQNGMKFSTPDQDNDLTDIRNCAVVYSSGNWFNDCGYQHVNDIFGSNQFTYASSKIIFCRMMIKRKL